MSRVSGTVTIAAQSVSAYLFETSIPVTPHFITEPLAPQIPALGIMGVHTRNFFAVIAGSE
jgi:hypothetical protein